MDAVGESLVVEKTPTTRDGTVLRRSEVPSSVL